MIQIKRGRGSVRIEHVRSHIGVPGNELVDRTADRAMRNAGEVKAAAEAIPPRAPRLLTIDLDWVRAQMRAITGSNRLRPPPSAVSTPNPQLLSPPLTTPQIWRWIDGTCACPKGLSGVSAAIRDRRGRWCVWGRYKT